MRQSFRQLEIIDIARRDGRVTVDGLAAHFGVTVQTVRRDLTELSDTGKLARVHGGAIPASGTSNIGYEDRRALNADAKRAMARACAAKIPNNAAVFLNIGTSTEAVAHELLSHQNLMVVTNNINIANILADNETCQVVVAGGALRRSDGGLIGALTMQTIRQFKFDFAVIGCSGLDLDGDLMDYDIQEVGVSQIILQQSRKAYLVADHSKFQRAAPARIASLCDVDTLFTDRALPGDLAARCKDWGTQVVLAH